MPVTRASQPPASAQPAPVNATNPSRLAATPAATARTHIVKAGDRPSSIARMYGVKLEALMAANPKVEPRRLQVGQTLNIPAP
jgi:LysM repeat protein